MPKDPTRNINQYKIRGGHLNEFEFHQNQADISEQYERSWEKEKADPKPRAQGRVVKGPGSTSKAQQGKTGKPAAAGSTRKRLAAKAVKPAKSAKKAARKSSTASKSTRARSKRGSRK